MLPIRRTVAAAKSWDATARPAGPPAHHSSPSVTSRPSNGEARRCSSSVTKLHIARRTHGAATISSSAHAAFTVPSTERSSVAAVVQPQTAPSAASTPRQAPAPIRPRSASRRACEMVCASSARPTSAAAARATRSSQSRASGMACITSGQHLESERSRRHHVRVGVGARRDQGDGRLGVSSRHGAMKRGGTVAVQGGE